MSPNQLAEGTQPRVQNSKVFAYIYLIFAVIVIVLSVFDLQRHDWISFCGNNISLTKVYRNDYHESVSQAKEHCDEISPSYRECGSNMCDILQELETSGQAMLGMGITSNIYAVISPVLILLLELRPTIIASGLTALMWVAGTIVYLGNSFEVGSSGSNPDIEFGLFLALAITILQLINCALGNVAISKLSR